MERKREERHGGRPVGDPIPQRGKVVAYTQASQPRMQPSTRTHITIMLTKKTEEKITSAHYNNFVCNNKKINTHFVLLIIIFVISVTTETQWGNG